MFRQHHVTDKDHVIKERAGVKNLEKYSGYIEIITLSELLNIPFDTVLKTSDIFCTKILLYNLEKANFENRYFELKRKK